MTARLPIYMRIGNGEEYHVGDLTLEPGEQANEQVAFVLRSVADQIDGLRATADMLAALDKEVTEGMLAALDGEAEEALPADLRNQE